MIKYVFGGASLGTDKSSIFRVGIKTRKACDNAILYVDIHPTAKTTLPAECLNGTVFDNCVYIHFDSGRGFRDNPTDPIKKLATFIDIEGEISCQRLLMARSGIRIGWPVIFEDIRRATIISILMSGLTDLEGHSRSLVGDFTGFENVQICTISLYLQICFGDKS